MPIVVAFETLPELLLNLHKKYGGSSKTAFAYKPTPDDEYKPVYWNQVRSDAEAVAAYMIHHGIESGDRVAILSENRYEWAVVDLGMQLIGAVNVALYTSLPPNQCSYILQDSEAKMFFVSTGIQLKKAVEVFDQCEDLGRVVAFDEPRLKELGEEDYVFMFEKIVAEGKTYLKQHRDEIKRRTSQISPEDIATLIYTSGTTGQPKGAMLTHRNIVSNIKSAHQHIDIRDDDRCLSFLPLCHSFERTGGYYAMMAGGAEIYYAESVDTVARNMPEAKPTIIISVPRLFERIYNLVTKSIEEGPDIKKRIFDWALNVGEKYSKGKRGLVSLQKPVADRLVFDKLKERTGGHVRFFVSGGAALPPEIGNFFMAAGLHVLEGYGLTETSPIIAANKVGKEVMGSVGQVINGVTVGIQRLEDNEIIAQLSGEDYPTDLTSEAGEIIVKGPNVMKGYWKRERDTREMIDDDGWLHTGDVGRFVNGNLQITDRIKHMIVNAGGKNVYPGPIEDMFKTSKWIDQLVVVGEKQPFMAALIVPDFDALKAYARERKIEYTKVEELLNNQEVQKIYRNEIRSFSKELASHEKIRDFRLVPDEFTIESGELTPTLKVKRRIVEDEYKYLIDDMFSSKKV